MRPTISQYAEVLAELSGEHSSLPSEVLAKNFLLWLKRRGEEKKLFAIVKRLEKVENEKEGRLSVIAKTAYEISKETKGQLEKKAESLFPGKKIELHHEIDSDVIGGVELRTEEVLYDATLRAELHSLKNSLLKV